MDQLTESQIIQRLSANTESSFDLYNNAIVDKYKKASVLIPFVRENDAWHIVFIRRAESDRDRHSGQVAFVGGKAEAYDDSEIDTALRETQEEIGINPSNVKILGQIGSHYSISRFQITPVVATIPWPYTLTLDPNEVSRTFTMPLTWLADKNNHEIRYRQAPEAKQKIPVIYFDEYQGELLWGATARMMLSLIKALKL